MKIMCTLIIRAYIQKKGSVENSTFEIWWKNMNRVFYFLSDDPHAKRISTEYLIFMHEMTQKPLANDKAFYVG